MLMTAAGCSETAASSQADAQKAERSAAGTESKTDPQESSRTETEAPPQASDAQETDDDHTFRVGGRFRVKSVEYQYTACGKYHPENAYLTPAEGNRFVFAELYCKNNGESNEGISWISFDCHADGVECKTATATDAISATMSPGRAAQGRVFFEVPTSAKDIRIGYRVSVLSDERAYLIVDGEQDAGFVPEKNTAPTEGALQPGGKFTAGGLEIKYQSCGEYTGEIYNRKAGCRYVQFALEVTNPTSEELRFSSLDLRACADGMCVQSYLAGSDTLTGKLAPGASASGEVVFIVPEDAQTVEAEYQQSFNGDMTVLAYQ